MIDAVAPREGLHMRRIMLPILLTALVTVAAFRLPASPRPVYAIDCDIFPDQRFAQLALRLLPDDPNGLDGPNDNGIACEELPCPCDTEPVEEARGDEDAPPPSQDADGQSGTTAGAGNASANTSASVSVSIHPTQTSPPAPAATAVPTLAPTTPGFITPPSTGSAGLK
jgi:hypothetical protein